MAEPVANPQAAAPATLAPYLADLNEKQREAVETLDGPVLVLAGAGTGKTRTLTTRLAHLLFSGKARPWEILAVTFTNKAAAEMKERVAALLRRPVEGWYLGTFHALGARMLRRHAESVGLKPNFTILDTDDQIRLLKQLMQAEQVDDKKWPARALLAVIQRWKDRALTPDKLSAADVGDFAGGRAHELYAQYQERLKTLNAADFGDLLLHVITLFQSHPDVLAEYQRQFKFLLVDEYQDTNVAQYLWLRLLAQAPADGTEARHNICCVGDDDQSIYGWRGAEVGNILRFEKDFPGAKIIRLEQNYRSTPHILSAASGLIAQNEDRLGKTLWTEAEAGEPIRVRGLWDGEEEARYVGEEVEALHTKGHALAEVAVLVRAGFQTREFEERFITLGLPYRVIGGPRFYERREIRDAMAYFRVVVQPDDDLAFERIINVPKRGIGPAALQALHGLARAQEIPLTLAAARLVATDELKPAARRSIAALIESFDRWRALLGQIDHTDLAETILDESGYTEMWQRDKSAEAPGRLENLKELIRALEAFDNLEGFLEHVSLVMENDEAAGGDRVNLMTLHGAKGLEFDSVFLPGWEEGIFPSQRTLDETGLTGLEEERRLAYVGITRARRRVFISYAANRRVYNQWQTSLPSRFLEELPDDFVERDADTGLYDGGQRDSAFGGGRLSEHGWSQFGDPVGGYGQRHGQGRRTTRWGAAERGEMQGRYTSAKVIEGRATTLETAPGTPRFALGDRVFHQKFGYGAINAIDGDKLTIAFEKAGEKKVLDSFVEPA